MFVLTFYSVANFFFSMNSTDHEKNIDVETLNPIKFNDEQRKRLGDAVHHSYLHPKPFKIGKLSLGITPTKSEKKTANHNTVKEAKHKFNII